MQDALSAAFVYSVGSELPFEIRGGGIVVCHSGRQLLTKVDF